VRARPCDGTPAIEGTSWGRWLANSEVAETGVTRPVLLLHRDPVNAERERAFALVRYQQADLAHL
jgi:hypothetical protein